LHYKSKEPMRFYNIILGLNHVVIQKEGHGSGDEHGGGFGLGNHGSQRKKNNQKREYTKIN
jgi:hypothetical protein